MYSYLAMVYYADGAVADVIPFKAEVKHEDMDARLKSPEIASRLNEQLGLSANPSTYELVVLALPEEKVIVNLELPESKVLIDIENQHDKCAETL